MVRPGGRRIRSSSCGSGNRWRGPGDRTDRAQVLRDDDALYVAVRAYDSDVREIRATQLRRDADLEVDDNITLLVDGFHDRRSGFVFRTNPNGAMWDAQFAGIWETTWHIDFMPRRHLLGILQLDLQFPIPSWATIAAETGSLLRTRDWETANFEWRPLGGTFQSGARFEVNIQRVFDAPPAPFEIFPGVTVAPGRYWWTRGELQYEMPKSHPVSLGGLVSWGGFFGGHDTAVEVQGEWRSGGRIVVGGLLSRSRVTLPEGSFTASQLTGRLEYALNTRTSFLGFGQYNTEDQRVDFNLRFRWIPRIGDDVYVVWNSGYTTDPTAPHRFPSWRTLRNPLNGALIVKAVHRFTP